MNKRNIITLIISMTALICLGISSNYSNIKNNLSIRNAKIEITLKDNMKVEFNSEIKVSDFIENINGKIINDYKIDTTIVGKKKINYEYINEDNIKIPMSYEIEVVDTVEPIIWLGSTYTIKVGQRFPIENILCGDNYDKNPTCYIEGEYNVMEEGAYPLVFKAEDSSGNVAKENFVLNVKKEIKTQYNTQKKEYIDYSKIVKKYKTKTNKIGIDISKWQGDIDFSKLKNQGVEFIIIRIGYTKGTNGEYVLDPKFIQNINGAKEYDIPVGLYFYSYANSVEHSTRDANWIISQIKDYDIELPIAFDWEEWNEFNDYEMSFYDLTKTAEAFIETLEKNGYKGMLYSSKSYLEYIWLPTKYDIWLAHYTDKTTYKGKYKYWQLCDNGKLDGIYGGVDVNIMYE